MTIVAINHENGYLTCDYPVNQGRCVNVFHGNPGESVEKAEARAYQAGWIVFNAFGGRANICYEHSGKYGNRR